MPTESNITRSIMGFLQRLPCSYAMKLHGSRYGQRGIPDILLIWKGRPWFFEVKTEHGKPTKMQELKMLMLRNAGAEAHVVRSVGDVRKILGTT